MFVNGLLNEFAIWFSVAAVFVVHVIVFFCCWRDHVHVLSSRVCVYCVRDPNVSLVL